MQPPDYSSGSSHEVLQAGGSRIRNLVKPDLLPTLSNMFTMDYLLMCHKENKKPQVTQKFGKKVNTFGIIKIYKPNEGKYFHI